MKCIVFIAAAALLLTSCASGNHSKPNFDSREAADKACINDLEAYLASEIQKSSDSRFSDNYTLIKSKHEEYIIFDYGCKPVFAKGSTTGVLYPTYFYLADYDGKIKSSIVFDLKPRGSSKSGFDFDYSYPLGKTIDFEAGHMESPEFPFDHAFSSVNSDMIAQGIAIGAVMRTCKSLFGSESITEEQAELEIEESREFLERVAKSALPYGPMSSKGSVKALDLLAERWEKCKKEESRV